MTESRKPNFSASGSVSRSSFNFVNAADVTEMIVSRGVAAANGEVFVSDTPRRLLSISSYECGADDCALEVPLVFRSQARGVRGSSD